MIVIRFGAVQIDIKNHTIRNGERCRKFAKFHPPNSRHMSYAGSEYAMFNLIKHMLLAKPLTTERLFEMLYGRDSDGGPLVGTKVIHIHLFNMKKIIAALDMTLVKSGRYGWSTYRVVPK